MARYLQVSVCLAILLTEAFGADGDSQIRVLKTVPIANIELGYIIGTVKCGATQELFLRLPDKNSGGVTSGSILKVSPDGQKTVTYSLDSVPDLNGGTIQDFAPTGTGDDLFLLVNRSTDEQYVVLFDDAGKYKSKSHLTGAFHARHIAAFSDQELLISGRETSPNYGSLLNAEPFLGIFGSDGQLLRRVEPRGDIAAFGGQSQSKKSKNDSGAGQDGLEKGHTDKGHTDKDFEKALNLSIAQAGQDGKVYVLRRTPSAPLFVISAGGEVTTIPLEPPEGATPVDVKVGQREAAIEYLRFKPDGENIDKAFFQVIDLLDGKKKAEYYHSNARIGASLACYLDNEDFVFASVDDQDHLSIMLTAPE